MIVDFIIGLFSRTVYITFGKEEFIFETKDKSIKLKTKIYLSDEGAILGIGDYFDNKNGVNRIDLFEKNISEKLVNKFEFLRSFIRYGIEELHNRKSFLRPKVIVQNVQELEEMLFGYENYILKVAVLDAGAREVYLIYKKFSNFIDDVEDIIKDEKKKYKKKK